MKTFINKLIARLEEIYNRNDKVKKEAYEEKDWYKFDLFTHRNEGIYTSILIVNELAEEHNGGWIPCTVVDHPEHCNDCEVTFKDVRGYGRDIAFYTDKWRRLSDEVPILVVAWKEPSAPYQPKGE